MTPTRTEEAWAAGLFEGEGCIYIRRPGYTGGSQVVLQMAMTDRDVVVRFQEVVGAGAVIEDRHYRRNGYKPQYRWRVGRRSEVTRILGMLMPFFGKRRSEKAENALARIRELEPQIR